jgi:hypothetical protein
MSRTTQHLRRALLPCTALAALAALSAGAAAQVTSAQQSAIRSNCRSDFMSHCSGVTPGGKEALACLQKNVAKLSGGCQTAVRVTIPAEAAPKMAAPAAAPPPPPAAVVEPAPAAKPATIVSAPPPKAQTAKKPMKPATAAVTPAAPPPHAAAEPGKPTAAQQSAIRANCRGDFQSKCSGVTPGGAEALSCLQSNVGSLAPACRTAVSATMKGTAPAAAVATAPATGEQPEPASAENGFVPGGMLISKACARTILMQCRGMTFDMKRKVACLADYAKSGHFVGPRCETALKVSGHLR